MEQGVDLFESSYPLAATAKGLALSWPNDLPAQPSGQPSGQGAGQGADQGAGQGAGQGADLHRPAKRAKVAGLEGAAEAGAAGSGAGGEELDGGQQDKAGQQDNGGCLMDLKDVRYAGDLALLTPDSVVRPWAGWLHCVSVAIPMETR